MNRRLLIILVAVAGVLFVAVLIMALIVKLQNPTDPNSVDSASNDAANNANNDATGGGNDSTRTTTSGGVIDGVTDTNDPVRVSADPVTTTDRSKINSLAISFTERYGSFSTDTGTDNIELLQSFMTDTMRQQADRVAGNSARNASQDFYGISTQSVNVDVVDFSEGATGATVEVSTRRTETKASAEPVIFSQTARLQMTKIGNAWKVNKFQWK